MTAIQTRRAIVVLALAIILQCSVPSHGALLDGRMMNVTLEHKTSMDDLQTGVDSGPFVVGAGVELQDFGMRTNPTLPPLVDINITDNTILITLVIDQPLAFLERLLFTDVMNNIPPLKNLTVDPSTNWAGFDPARIGGSSEEVIGVNLGQLSGLAGQFVLLNVTPEPAAAALLATCSVGAVALRRRVGRRSSRRRSS